MSRLGANTFVAVALASLMITSACVGGEDEPNKDDLYGMEGDLEPTPPLGKDDSQNRRGLWVNTNTRATQVWSATEKWEDTDTPRAKLAGMAWGADSGLTWDQKFTKWVDSMSRTASIAGYYDTFMLTTPWGKTLPSPKLECAEMAMFLRISFAAWYNLPFFLEAMDRHGTRIYFGHNGVRTRDGRYKSTPNYGHWYKDHTKMTAEQYTAEWPRDDKLRKRKMYGGTDDHSTVLGQEGAVTGTYMDEIHLNKRVGYFTMLTLNYLGSVNLADANNMYNIVPESVRSGDVLVHRWQRNGIGHVMIVKSVTPIGEGNLDVNLASGSMPRRQAKWESGYASKSNLTNSYAGGEGSNSDGREYVKLGGGIKRFRVTKNIGGYWTNTWMRADEANWINSTDYDRLRVRPARFEAILGEVSPEQQKTSLLASIEDARNHLRRYPASCSARERRERAFEDLYDLMARAPFNMDKAEVDRQFRKLEDEVLAELEYDKSKTCCWNSTNAGMYGVIMEKARREQAQADADGVCLKPTVFMNHTDGYDRWKTLASELGTPWVPWSEDETCNQRDVAADTEAEHQQSDFCDRGESNNTDACSDSLEDNNSQETAARPAGGESLKMCEGDVDWFYFAGATTVTIEFDHSVGDLDMAVYNASGERLDISQSTSNSESLEVGSEGGYVKVYGYQGATGDYTLSL